MRLAQRGVGAGLPAFAALFQLRQNIGVEVEDDAVFLVIRGDCLSAWVIFTTLPNACIAPNAQIGFLGTTPKLGIPEIDLWLDMRMGQYFRGEAKRLFISEWRNLEGKNAFHVISAREYKRLDPEIVICSPEKK